MDNADLQRSQQPQVPQQAAPQSPSAPSFIKPANKKIWLYLGIGILLIFSAAAAYWYFWKPAIAPIEDLAAEDEILNKDLADLESLERDKSLDNLEYDLTRAAGEQIIVETASVESLEKELSDELDSLSNDLAGLEEFSNDASLGNLDSGLSGASE